MHSLLQFFAFLKLQLQRLKHRCHITTFDISVFLRQFASLIAAGIPIIQSCELLEKSQEKNALRLLIYSIKRDILSGKNLYFSFKQHPRYFDELTCQLVQIGEHTGKLDMMLNTIASYQEKNQAFANRVKQALFYPCIISITAVIATFCMFIFIIPRFAELFQEMQNTLPALTVWIFFLAGKMQQYSLLIIGISLLLALIIFYAKHSTSLKFKLMRIINKFPLINRYHHKVILARFARNLAITFTAGIPITEALKLTADACNNTEFINIIARLRTKIISGLQLHHAMASSPFFPSLMIQMVKIGEESGMLEQMLDNVAGFFEADIDQLIERLNQLLEPLIMMVLGVLIGGLVIGMYLPIFKLGSVL